MNGKKFAECLIAKHRATQEVKHGLENFPIDVFTKKESW